MKWVGIFQVGIFWVGIFQGEFDGWRIFLEPSKTLSRSNHKRCLVRKGVLRNFAKFTAKHLCQSLFFNKVAGHLRTTASDNQSVGVLVILLVYSIPCSKFGFYPNHNQKQLSRGAFRKRCSKNMQQIYRRTSMLMCDFSKVAKNIFIEITFRYKCSPVNVLHIFRTSFLRTPLEGCFCLTNLMVA